MNYNGVINIFKPRGWTSHDVVAFLRRILKTKKVGHAGTLDPDAIGVLPILVGQGTKLSSLLMEKDKVYTCELIFGTATTTQDATGEVTAMSDHYPTDEALEAELNRLSGDEIDQIPPMYSAVKKAGKPLYRYAREGLEIDRKPRRCMIYHIEHIKTVDLRRRILRVHCSKGTYIRTLCHDIGARLGTYAHMGALVRTRAGQFDLHESCSPKLLEQANDKSIFIQNPGDILTDCPRLDITAAIEERLENGQKIPFWQSLDRGLYRLFVQDRFVGLGIRDERMPDCLKMKMRWPL